MIFQCLNNCTTANAIQKIGTALPDNFKMSSKKSFGAVIFIKKITIAIKITDR